MGAVRKKERVRIDPVTWCWIWLLRKNKDGYGYEWAFGKSFLAHRNYYEMFIGPIPEGMDLDHRCRRRDCVNPAHLAPVTETENVRLSTRTKLCWPQVREIRQRVAAGECYKDMAKDYGVQPYALYDVIRGRTWKEE
jgi:hypothetical protein